MLHQGRLQDFGWGGIKQNFILKSCTKMESPEFRLGKNFSNNLLNKDFF